ncbi:MAG TPA: HD domain-containing phosphohydrolase [Pirellulales bacterium]|jgi:HD-GYP domain-containing protein (c-di-GMP phosphodiesterase class II)|nr:HD domain-containing phosphohydrolase [Pirellulales bacterium]
MGSAQSTAELLDDVHSRGFVPIAVDTLLPSAVYDFDLYLRQSAVGRLTLYRRRSYPLDQSDLDRLLKEGVRTLHVPYEDRDVYANYLKSLLAESHQFTPQQKYKILKAAARSLLSDTFSGNSLDSYLLSVDSLSQQMVESICSDDLLLRDIFFLMTHDYYSYTHVTNVSTYCLALARELGIHEQQELVDIVGGALLHDLGKRHLPPGLLNKPGKLTDPEMALMRQHPQKGFEELCLRGDLIWGQLMMVYQHHERLDGKGYPVQVCGDEIHPWAKLCAVADVFDAVTSARPYRKPVAIDAALEFFERRAGVAFDAEMVRCLSSLMRQN